MLSQNFWFSWIECPNTLFDAEDVARCGECDENERDGDDGENGHRKLKPSYFAPRPEVFHERAHKQRDQERRSEDQRERKDASVAGSCQEPDRVGNDDSDEPGALPAGSSIDRLQEVPLTGYRIP